MTGDDLKRSLSELLAEEEDRGSVDWDRVQDLSIGLLNQIRSSTSLQFPPELVIPYLTQFAMRQSDASEAERQHAQLVAYLRDH